MPAAVLGAHHCTGKSVDGDVRASPSQSAAAHLHCYWLVYIIQREFGL